MTEVDYDYVIRSKRWTDDRSYEMVPVPTPYWCAECGEQGVPTLKDGERCLACGAEQIEPMRVGWDESD